MSEKGTVKLFRDPQGFGFISRANGSPDVFVHYSGIVANGDERRTLVVGQTVVFDVVPSPNHPGKVMADNVRVVPA